LDRLSADPTGRRTAGGQFYTADAGSLVSMSSLTNNLVVGITGGSQPFSNQGPYQGMNYIMCVEGIFPSRN
jgi:microcystin-dependent protein